MQGVMPAGRWTLLNLLGAIVLFSLLCAGPTYAQDYLKWTFSEGNDPAARGRSVARLVYGVPETDNQQFAGVCEARSSTSISFSSLTLAADVGRLKNGASVKVRFSGGGREHEIAGEVTGVGNTTEGISGIIIRPKHNDQVWSMMSQLPAVDYMIPGYRTSVLNLQGGHAEIKSFVSTCKAYENALSPAAPAAAASGISEKEAFDLAKEIGTVDGWNAFLAQFPNGSRAGFARAYIKRLGQGSAPAPAGNQSANTANSAPASAVRPAALPKPTLPTVARGPASSLWVNRTERIAGRSVYTASVRVPGVELVTFCAGGANDRGLGAIVRRKGSYPSFAERIRQGLAARPILGNGPNRQIKIEFSNGEIIQDGAAEPGLVAQSLGFGPGAAAFGAQSTELEYLMSENEMTVELEPFLATFQLRGSRKAICAVMNRCGAQVPRCSGGTSTRTVQPVPATRPLRCGKNYRLSRGKCVLLQNCGRNAYRNPEGDCFCNRGFRRTASGRCVRAQRECASGQYRDSRGRCVFKKKPQRCTGGRTIDPGTGRCDCNGDSVWNGRQCVKENEPQRRPPQNNAKQNVCKVLQAACQFGSKAACKNFQKGGC